MTAEKWRDLLKKHNSRVASVAGELGISRKACCDNFRKYGISPAGFR
jgi:transcriptional regulator of acetoin/glycerol metabolism